ncbi:MAG: NUDIX hydrolase, partial [Pseudomonadota bacterium]
MLTVHDLSPNVEVIALGPAPALPASLEAEVSAIWEKEKAQRPDRLFDGRIFSVAALARERISGCFVPYRRLIAGRASPALFASLQVRPLAVSGLLTCADGIAFARRAAGLTDDPGRWELVPSGGVTPDCVDASGKVDLGRQILAELAEEVGMAASDVAMTGPFLAVEGGDSHVVDIGFALATPLVGDQVRARHARQGSSEYTEIAVVAESEIPRFAASLGAALAPVSRALLERRGLISAKPATGPGA